MPRKAKVQVEWDPELEDKIEKKVDEWSSCCGSKKTSVVRGNDAVYGIGLIGALIYFISTADSFWDGVVGVLQAIIWPGYVVFELLKYFNV